MGFDRDLPIKERILKRRRQKRRRFLAILLLLSAFCIYMFVLNWKTSNNTEAKAENEGSFKIHSNEDSGNNEKIEVTDNYLHENSIEEGEKKGIDNLKNDLEKYISGFEGTYGVYYLDLVNGQQFGINDKEEYIAASTVKMPLNLYLYKKISEGNVKRDGILTYTKEDYEEGTGEIRYGEFGKKYRIHELAKLSIEKSDNVATNMLFRFLEKQKVKNFMVSCGGMVVNRDENITCPRDLALYMMLLYDFCKKEKTLGKELLGYFENTDFNDRLPALLPKGVRVAHKTGNQVRVVNDVGIIFAHKPYVLAVMSKEVNEDQACKVIANISKKVYDYVESTD